MAKKSHIEKDKKFKKMANEMAREGMEDPKKGKKRLSN
jgi:hypothetical protein